MITAEAKCQARGELLPGSGVGLVVSVLAYYSEDLSSNPAGYLNLLYKKTKINEREAGTGPSLKRLQLFPWSSTNIYRSTKIQLLYL